MDADSLDKLIGVLLALAGVAAVFYVLIVKRRGEKWGINVKRVNCPQCGAEQPVVRKPKNFQQMMWGGSTCPECGVEMDKWGRRTG